MPPDRVVYIHSWSTEIDSLRLPEQYRSRLEYIIVPLSDLAGAMRALRAGASAPRIGDLPDSTKLAHWNELYHELHTSTARSLEKVRADLVRAHVMLRRPSPLVFCGKTGACAHDLALVLAQTVAGFAAHVAAPLVRSARSGIPGRAKLRASLKQFPCHDLKINELYALMAEEAVAAAGTIQRDGKGEPQKVGSPPVGQGRVMTQEEIIEFERTVPPLNTANGEWVTNKIAAKLEGIGTRTLSDYCQHGITADGRYGRDKDGRVWRREGRRTSHPRYLKSTLINSYPKP